MQGLLLLDTFLNKNWLFFVLHLASFKCSRIRSFGRVLGDPDKMITSTRRAYFCNCQRLNVLSGPNSATHSSGLDMKIVDGISAVDLLVQATDRFGHLSRVGWCLSEAPAKMISGGHQQLFGTAEIRGVGS